MSTYKLSDIRAILDERFIKNEEMADVYFLALNNNLNVLLTGPPGTGKSDRDDYLKERLGLAIDHHTLQFRADMAPEELFGGHDLAYYKETGKLRFNWRESWLNYPYVRFEEIGDANGGTITACKDILSSGKFINASEVVDIKLSSLVATSNLTVDEMSDNDSIRAVFERFHMHVNVDWDSFTQDDYEELFKKRMGERIPELAQWFAEQADIRERPFRPRLALNCAKLYEIHPRYTIYAAGFPAELNATFLADIEEMRSSLSKVKGAQESINSIREGIQELAKQVEDAVQWSNTEHMKTCLADIEEAKMRIREVNAPNMPMNIAEQINEMFRNLKAMKQKIDHKL